MSWVLPFISGGCVLAVVLFAICWRLGSALGRAINDRIHRSL